MLSKPFFERIPDQGIIAGEQGKKYDFVVATRGVDYAMIYNYVGRNMQINMGKIKGKRVKASWFNPRTGDIIFINNFKNVGIMEFNPPGEKSEGNDWVLVLEKI